MSGGLRSKRWVAYVAETVLFREGDELGAATEKKEILFRTCLVRTSIESRRHFMASSA